MGWKRLLMAVMVSLFQLLLLSLFQGCEQRVALDSYRPGFEP